MITRRRRDRLRVRGKFRGAGTCSNPSQCVLAQPVLTRGSPGTFRRRGRARPRTHRREERRRGAWEGRGNARRRPERTGARTRELRAPRPPRDGHARPRGRIQARLEPARDLPGERRVAGLVPSDASHRVTEPSIERVRRLMRGHERAERFTDAALYRVLGGESLDGSRTSFGDSSSLERGLRRGGARDGPSREHAAPRRERSARPRARANGALAWTRARRGAAGTRERMPLRASRPLRASNPPRLRTAPAKRLQVPRGAGPRQAHILRRSRRAFEREEAPWSESWKRPRSGTRRSRKPSSA